MPTDDQNTPPPVNTPPPANPPPADDPKQKELDRVLTENAAIRKSLKDAEAARTQQAEELAALKRAGHKNTGDWQKVAETAETEAKTWKEKHEAANRAFVNTLVGSKVREEALKLGFKKDLIDLLDAMEFEEIQADIEGGKFNVKGADVAISNLKKLRPSLFDEVQPPKFNAGGASSGLSNSAPGSLKEAEAAYLAALKNKFKDPAAFNQAHLNYQKAIFEARKAKK